MVNAAEEVTMDAILQYCGFDNEDHQLGIAIDGIEAYSDMLSLTEKDI